MKNDRSTLLLLCAALVIAAALSAFKIIDSPSFGGLEATSVRLTRFDAAGSDKEESRGKININTAGVDELASLEDVGKIKAKAIVEYREKHGAFRSADDLTRVEGIGAGTVNKNRDRITLD